MPVRRSASKVSQIVRTRKCSPLSSFLASRAASSRGMYPACSVRAAFQTAIALGSYWLLGSRSNIISFPGANEGS